MHGCPDQSGTMEGRCIDRNGTVEAENTGQCRKRFTGTNSLALAPIFTLDLSTKHQLINRWVIQSAANVRPSRRF